MSTKALTFAYKVGNGIYINLTNRCSNSCEFCLRSQGDGAYGSDSLWLEREPTAEEAFSAVVALYDENCDEFVFCGYGEPTERTDVMLKVASLLKAKFNIPIRLNTNGQGSLIANRNIAPGFSGIINTVSISLNRPDAKSYQAICHSVYGEACFEAILDFARECKAYVPNVIFSVVEETLSQNELCECKRISNDLGVTLRIRTYIGKK